MDRDLTKPSVLIICKVSWKIFLLAWKYIVMIVLKYYRPLESHTILASLHRPYCSAFPLQTFCVSYVYPSVIHFFTKQLSQSKFIWQKLEILLSHTSWKFHAIILSGSKVINDSCFFVFSKEIADCSSIRLATLQKKDFKYL